MGTGEYFRELYLDATHNSLPAGAKIGPVVVATNLMPVDPATQQVVGSDMEGQLRALFQNMDRVLESGGCSRKDVARVTLFMRQVSDRTAMNKVYKEWYPDEDGRPPHKYVPAELPEGVHVAAQVIALPGRQARAIEIPGIHHQDWMSLGGLTGNLVTSSRIFGTDPATGKGSQDADEHTAIIFNNADKLLELAGGSWANLQQVTAFIGGDELRETVLTQWRKRGSERENGPALHFIETNLGGRSESGPMLPRLEIIALL
jgi:2-iminobutanoate/2-iminopropanoate deaminase